MKYCSISKRFIVVNSSDSNVGHLKIGVIEQSDISHLNWLKWLATEVFLLLRISNRWLWNLCLRERFVWPMYCKPQLSHSIKYIKLFELQLMLVCILKVCLVAVLTISERGSKYVNDKNEYIYKCFLIINIKLHINNILPFDDLYYRLYSPHTIPAPKQSIYDLSLPIPIESSVGVSTCHSCSFATLYCLQWHLTFGMCYQNNDHCERISSVIIIGN